MIIFMCETELFKNIIAVSNRHLTKRPFLEQVEIICQHKPKAIILREKDLPEEEYVVLAKNVISICKKYNVDCILHNYVNAAKQLGCKSIHLPLSVMRQRKNELYSFSQIGTSVHTVQEAKEAQSLGATYLAAGHIYATDCKKDLQPRGLGFLENVCKSVSIPVFAIGGIKIKKEQLNEVMLCGAKGSCIMSEIMRL